MAFFKSIVMKRLSSTPLLGSIMMIKYNCILAIDKQTINFKK